MSQALFNHPSFSKSCEIGSPFSLISLDQSIELKSNSEAVTGKTVFDHKNLLKDDGLRINKITLYGEKFIEAICTEFIENHTGKSIIKLAKGSKFNPTDASFK